MTPPATLSVLSGADFDMYPGELVALEAPSGAGKSTLLHIAGLLERPDAGDVEIAGRGTGRLSDRERTTIRRVQIGFVYQFHHLLPEFSALENVVMPQLIRGLDRKLAAQRAMQLLAYMRVKERAAHRPARALRRRAAAGRHRPGGRQRAARPPRRRADRQSRPGDRDRRLRRADAARAGLQARRPHRHPQSRPGAAHGPADHLEGRQGGGTVA